LQEGEEEEKMKSRVKPMGEMGCPSGYEYVEAYRDQSGRYVPAYCRKLKKYRGIFADPMVREDRMRAEQEQKSLHRARDIVWGDSDDE
jgi:hypothetical protein